MKQVTRSYASAIALSSLFANIRFNDGLAALNPNPTFFQRGTPASLTTVGNGAVP
jgi:hypothetical protein